MSNKRQRTSEETPVSRPAGTKGAKNVPEQAKCWMITLNMTDDPTDAESKIRLQRFNAGCQVHPCSFAVFQPEIAPETGRHHVQAYVEMAKPCSLKKLKDHFGKSIHAEIRAGTQQQAIDYCTKLDTRVPDGEIVRFGEPMKLNKNGDTRGSRTDWQTAWQLLKDGRPVFDVLDTFPHMLPATRALTHGRSAVLEVKERSERPHTIVLYGEPDTGKSSSAERYCAANGLTPYHVTIQNNLWFDGYDPMKHDAIIFEEFSGQRMKLSMLNQLLDKFPCRVETKGGHLPWLVKCVLFTSNYPPRQWYKFDDPSRCLNYDALFRRLDVIANFSIDASSKGRYLHVEDIKSVFPRDCVSSKFKLKSTGAITPYLSTAKTLTGRRAPLEIDDDDSPAPPPKVNKGKRKVPERELQQLADDASHLSQPRRPPPKSRTPATRVYSDDEDLGVVHVDLRSTEEALEDSDGEPIDLRESSE